MFSPDEVHGGSFTLARRPDRGLGACALGGVVALEDPGVVGLAYVDAVAGLGGDLERRGRRRVQ